MDSEVQQLLDSETITLDIAGRLENLKPGTGVTHKSWGAGLVKEWDALESKMIIDFDGKPAHPMDFDFAAKSLKPLPADHIVTRIFSKTDELKKEAEEEPVKLMASVVSSLGKNATAERIEDLLTPVLIETEKWKKWWDAAKRAMRKDGRFEVPSRRTQALVFHDEEPDRQGQSIEIFRSGVGPKAKIKGLDALSAHWSEIKTDELLEEVLKEVDDTLNKIPMSQLSSGLELVLARQEFLAQADAGDPHTTSALDRLLPRRPEIFMERVEALPSVKQGRVVELARKTWAQEWAEFAPKLLARANAKVAEVIIKSYREEGRMDELVGKLQRLINERNLHYDFLMWLCKNRAGEFKAIVNADLFGVILSALEFDQLSGTRKAGKLERLLFSDKELMRDLLANCNEEEVRDVTRAIISSPAFADLDKRSLLAMVVKQHAHVQDMISGSTAGREDKDPDAEPTTQTLIVSWESLERRQAELEELVTKKIPENSREIQVARSYGDLKENHEFKSAKEMQTVLMRRQGELEAALAKAQGTDFADVDTSTVNVGTIVTIRPSAGGETQTYTILGAWDSDPEKGIISYLTAVAQALMGKKEGDEASVTNDDGSELLVKIDSIRSYA
ncbi:MAG: GreA/GreB family elongation factor [Verrucomicrobiota bacterium]